jgi:hypothetical protein
MRGDKGTKHEACFLLLGLRCSDNITQVFKVLDPMAVEMSLFLAC